MWPAPEEFREAVQSPKNNIGDPHLAAGEIVCDNWGLPSVSSGNFASVYKVRCADADYAFRCFLSGADQRSERYTALTDFITHDDLECTVHFEYLNKGVLVRGSWFPAVKMTWVEGIELDSFINSSAGEPAVLNQLADQFALMVRNLHEVGIAHADLQHGNIIVTEDGLRLVDYDGMYVPALHELNANELGHRNYQHPARCEDHFGPYLDNFSAWLIDRSIRCIAHDGSLWRGARDCLLFSHEDLVNPERSMLFSIVEHHRDPFIRESGQKIRHLLQLDPSEVPPLQQHFEVGDLSDILPPAKLREQLMKEEEDEILRPAPRMVQASGGGVTDDSQTNKLRVTSEVRYMGLPMGVSELRLLSKLREENLALVEAGRDTLRRVQYFRTDRAEMEFVGEFPWVPFYGFAYHQGEEILVKISGRIDPAVTKEFAIWARRAMRGTWVTDGTSRFQFWEDSGSLTYELAAYKPRTLKNDHSPFWDWFWDDPAQMAYRRKGRYHIPGFLWGKEYEVMQHTTTLFEGRAYGNNAFRVRSPDPITFFGWAMSPEFRFVKSPPTSQRFGNQLLYEIRLSVPPALSEFLRKKLVHAYGWPDQNNVWADGCATMWSSDNTTITWEEVSEQLHLTYLPLAVLVDTTPLVEKITKFFRLDKTEPQMDA